jgi:hypothetical protein
MNKATKATAEQLKQVRVQRASGAAVALLGTM